MQKLLIISCSNAKLKDIKPIPAMELYDGINYKVIKKLKREGKFPKNLDVIIISAKYGFLEPDDLIEYYNQKMNKKRALELHDDILQKFKVFLQDKSYNEVLVNLGTEYVMAIEGFEKLFDKNTKIAYTTGGIGQKTSEMKDWILSIK